jgi:RND family efflux transporter MFP subunit
MSNPVSSAQERAEKIRSLSITPVTETPSAPARTGWRKLAVAMLVGVPAIAAAYYAGSVQAPVQQPAPVAVKPTATAVAATDAAPVAKGVRFEAQGFVTATRHATVSTRVAGIVRAVNVEAGDRVVQGQVLGVLDADLARRELELAEGHVTVLEARVRSAEAQLRQAERDAEQEQQLFARQFSSQARSQQKQTAAEVAAAAVQSARADLKVAKVQVEQTRSMLSNYTIRAPFAGIVTEKNAQPGELIAPSGAGGGFTRTGLCTIVDTNSLEVVVDVSEQLVTQVVPGQPVQLTLYAYQGKNIRGQVSRIMPSADRAKGTLQVRLAIIDKDARILPDMRARVAFL